jgi:hypothetical protein
MVSKCEAGPDALVSCALLGAHSPANPIFEVLEDAGMSGAMVKAQGMGWAGLVVVVLCSHPYI